MLHYKDCYKRISDSLLKTVTTKTVTTCKNGRLNMFKFILLNARYLNFIIPEHLNKKTNLFWETHDWSAYRSLVCWVSRHTDTEQVKCCTEESILNLTQNRLYIVSHLRNDTLLYVKSSSKNGFKGSLTSQYVWWCCFKETRTWLTFDCI